MEKSSVLMIIIIFLAFSCLPFSRTQDLAADRAALLSLRSSAGGRTLLWNVSNPNPCSWAGVSCELNRVTVLRLPGVSLSGQIPNGVFGNLTKLRTLSLRFNALSGSIPTDLALCTGLHNLYLQGNAFSGEFPAFLSGLTDLVRLNLAGNNFSGEISSSFKNLTKLKTLYLENNQLSGSIPDLDLPLDQFNVSNNLLNGSIPEHLKRFDSDSFGGNSLCGKPLGICATDGTVASDPDLNGNDNNPTDNTKNTKKKLSAGAIAGIVIGSLVVLALLLLILILLCRKKERPKSRSIDIAPIKQQEVETRSDKPVAEYENSVAAAAAAAMVGNNNNTDNNKGGGGGGAVGEKKLIFFGNSPKVFDLEDLLRASAEVLGKGTFGTAYKAVLNATTAVAVKRLRDVVVSDKEFKEKIENVGAMDHQNLVPVRAYYYSRDEKLLVFDYMPMGSLSALLHGNKGAGRTPLNWDTRCRIALGAARGITYLHSQGPNVTHGNIKSSNVILTRSYDACVSDFGLGQLVGPSSTPNRVSGYRAPEVTDPRRVSQKADVYSFGVLILELLTGKAPTHSVLNDEGVDLPRWVQSTVKEEWTNEVFDLELLKHQSGVEEEMVQLLQLAIDCTAQHPDNRPSMAEITRRIEELPSSHKKSNEEQNMQHDRDIVTDYAST